MPTPKTVHRHFVKGILGEWDSRSEVEGHAMFMGNVVLHSGIPKPVRTPVWSSIAVPSGTKTVFEFRGTWYFNSLQTTYEADRITNGGGDSHDRVFWSDPTTYPKIRIDNTITDRLGIPRPVEPLLVQLSSALVSKPSSLILTYVNDSIGVNVAGTYTYALGLKIGDAYYPTQISSTITLTGTGSIKVQWDPGEIVADYVVIYGRADTSSTLLAERPVSDGSWLDYGSATGTPAPPSGSGDTPPSGSGGFGTWKNGG